MSRHLFVLLACLFVVMIGFGITAPVLPFYVERLAATGQVSPGKLAMHIGFLTGMYPLGQLVFAPLWGRRSDRTGRRPLLLLGISGYALGQVLFAFSLSLWLLYAARILGGIISSAILPTSASYVADMTDEEKRGRGMAWLGTATSLGFVVGPGLAGLLTRRDLHFSVRYWCFMVDSFSIPFLVAAFLGALTLFVAAMWLPESFPAPGFRVAKKGTMAEWRRSMINLRSLVLLTLLGQFVLAVFETMFALYAKDIYHFGPTGVGAAFMVCGLVMAVFQTVAVALFSGRAKEIHQVATGFGLMGVSVALLLIARGTVSVFGLVALLAFGMSLVSPNLAALISKRGGLGRTGEALGLQNAASSLGQASGPLLAGVLFGWWVAAPYLLAGALSVGTALTVVWGMHGEPHSARVTQ